MQVYNNIDQRIHQISQIIAKISRTYVPKKEDDSHTNVYFDSVGERLLGRWIETKNSRIILSFDLVDLHFQWLDGMAQIIATVNAKGKTIDEIENEIIAVLPPLGLAEQGSKDKLHFQIPDYSFKNDPVMPFKIEDLTEWMAFRSLANDACITLTEYTGYESETRIWPHHFDTGIYTVIGKKIGIGFGLAMQDSNFNEPYFYMTGYPHSGSLSYENLPEFQVAKWEIGENFKGAVLTLGALKVEGHGMRSLLRDYIKTGLSWYLKQ